MSAVPARLVTLYQFKRHTLDSLSRKYCLNNCTAGIKHAVIDCFASAVFMWYVALSSLSLFKPLCVAFYLFTVIICYLYLLFFTLSTFVVNKHIILFPSGSHMLHLPRVHYFRSYTCPIHRRPIGLCTCPDDLIHFLQYLPPRLQESDTSCSVPSICPAQRITTIQVVAVYNHVFDWLGVLL